MQNMKLKKENNEIDRALAGILRVLILPLAHQVPEIPPVKKNPDIYPFMPSMCENNGQEIGFGQARLVAHKVREKLQGRTFGFGQSYATLKSEGFDVEQVPSCVESSCVSLWWMPESGRFSLVIEILDDDGLATEVVPGLQEFFSRNEILEWVHRRLGRQGAAKESPNCITIRELLGESFPVDVLGEKVTLNSLLIDSVDFVRGEPLVEGLFAYIGARLDGMAEDLASARYVEDYDYVEYVQSSGYDPEWDVLKLVQQPGNNDSYSAIRADNRMVVLNLESASVYHEYVSFGAGAYLLAAMPLLNDFSALENAYVHLRSDLIGAHADQLTQTLEELERIRLDQTRRYVAYTFAQEEKFVTWTHRDQLASFLLRRLAPRVSLLDEGVQKAASALQASIERSEHTRAQKVADTQSRVEEHQRHIDLQLSIFAPVIGLAALLGVFAALAAVPSSGQWSCVAINAHWITLGTLIIGILVGFCIFYARRSSHKKP